MSAMWFYNVAHDQARKCETRVHSFPQFNDGNRIMITVLDSDALVRLRLFMSQREAGDLMAQIANGIRENQEHQTQGGQDAHNALPSIER